MKHVLWALAASSLLTVTACGNDDGGDPNNNNTATCNLAIEPTFDSIHDLVLSNTAGPKGCAQASCHGATAFGGLNFTLGKDEVFRQLTQDPVMNPAATVTKRVDTTAENSYLYLRLNSGEMPPGGLDAACADEIKQAVVGWIGTGGGRQ